MAYLIKLSDGSSLLDITPLEGNGVGNVTTALEIKSVEFADIAFSVPAVDRPDAFVVSGDVQVQYTNGTVFEVTGNTGYDGTYVVDLTGFNRGDQVAAYANGETHIPVASIDLATFDLLELLSSDTKLKVRGGFNGQSPFLPGRTLTFADNSNAPSNGQTRTVSSATTSTSYQANTTNVGANTFGVIGDVTGIFSAAEFIEVTGTANGIGGGRYKVQSSSYGSGTTTIALDTSFRSLPTNFPTSPKPNLALTRAVTVVTLTAAAPSGTTASGQIVPQAPTTAPHPISPSITTISAHNFAVTWAVEGQFASQLVAGTFVQVKGARYNGAGYSPSFAITSVTQVAPNGTYPQGLTQIAFTVNDPSAITPVITADANTRLVFPVPPAPFGYVSYATSDAKTSLALVGQGAPLFNLDMTWGNALQTNLVHITENFANTLPPVAPLDGQIWFDRVTRSTRVWHGVVSPVVNVTTGAGGSWFIDGLAADLPGVGEVLVVYNNVGMGLTSYEYTVAAVTPVADGGSISGYITEIEVTGTIPAQADTQESSNVDAPFGNAYPKAMWKGLVTTTTVPALSDVNMGGYQINNLGDPTVGTDALNLQFADGRFVNVTGDSMSGTLAMTGSANVSLVSGNVALTNGNVTLTNGDVALTAGNVTLASGDISLGSGTNTLKIQNNGSAAADIVFNTSTATQTTDNAVINLGQNKIINLTTPTSGMDAANKAYVDSLANGITWLQPIVDPNLFDHTITTPPVSPEVYTRTYIVPPIGATGAWSTMANRAVTWNGTIWVDVLGRDVAVGDRFGVLINPDNDELGSLPSPGGNLTGHAGQIATVTTIGSYTFSFYTPHEPDAVSVTGKPSSGSSNEVNYSPHFGHSYTFRGTWGTGTYGINYQWIEFAGPQMLVDGAGLRYTGNILNVGQGTGIVVGADAVAVDTSYLNTNYLRRSGVDAMTGQLTLAGLPTNPLHAASKSYVDALTLDSLTDVVITTPATGNTLYYDGANWVNTPAVVGAYRNLGTLGVAAGVATVDCVNEYYTHTLTANITSIVFANLPPVNKAATVRIRFTQDGAGSHTIALPASFHALTTSGALASAAASVTILTITTFDQGTRWEYRYDQVA